MTACLSRLITLALLTSFVALTPAFAQTPPPDADRVAAAKDLLDAMKAKEQFQKTLDTVQKVLSRQMQAQPNGDKAMPVIAKTFEPGSAEVTAYFVDAETAMLNFYTERFTAEEMKAIASFQRSPAGQKLQAASTDMMGALGPPLNKFQESLKKVLVEQFGPKPKQ